jgi:hypothetical protein
MAALRCVLAQDHLANTPFNEARKTKRLFLVCVWGVFKRQRSVCQDRVGTSTRERLFSKRGRRFAFLAQEAADEGSRDGTLDLCLLHSNRVVVAPFLSAHFGMLKRLDPNENGRKFEPRRVSKPFL